jgi:hypothetical protein
MPSFRTAFVLTVTAAAATAVAAPAATAAAAPAEPPPDLAGALPTRAAGDLLPLNTVVQALPTRHVTGALHESLAGGLGPAKHLTLDPLSHTGTDPLDNSLGSQIADFQPVSTAAVTDPVTSGGSLSTLPVVGTVAGLLPG